LIKQQNVKIVMFKIYPKVILAIRNKLIWQYFNTFLKQLMGDDFSYLRNTNVFKISWKTLKNNGDKYYFYNLATMFLSRCEIYSANITGVTAFRRSIIIKL